MSRPEDDFTSTVEGAAAFERRYGEYYDPDPDFDPAAEHDEPYDPEEHGEEPLSVEDEEELL